MSNPLHFATGCYTPNSWMVRQRKASSAGVLVKLSDEEQAQLFTFLRSNPIEKGCEWVFQKTGRSISPRGLYWWVARYSSARKAERLKESTARMDQELKDAGFKVTASNLDDWVLNYFMREAQIFESPEIVLRLYVERKRLALEERRVANNEEALKLDLAKFKRLERIEDESRKALEAGGTEAELIAKWKQILNFGPS